MFSLIVHMFVNVNEDGIATVLLHFVSINHTHSLLSDTCLDGCLVCVCPLWLFAVRMMT